MTEILDPEQLREAALSLLALAQRIEEAPDSQATLAAQGRVVRDLKLRRKTAKDAADQIGEELALQQERFIERCEAEGVQGLRIDGRNLVPTQTEYGSINDLDEFVAWAQENDPALLKMAVYDGELNRLVRRYLEHGKPLPPGVTFYVKRSISDRAG